MRGCGCTVVAFKPLALQRWAMLLVHLLLPRHLALSQVCNALSPHALSQFSFHAATAADRPTCAGNTHASSSSLVVYVHVSSLCRRTCRSAGRHADGRKTRPLWSNNSLYLFSPGGFLCCPHVWEQSTYVERLGFRYSQTADVPWVFFKELNEVLGPVCVCVFQNTCAHKTKPPGWDSVRTSLCELENEMRKWVQLFMVCLLEVKGGGVSHRPFRCHIYGWQVYAQKHSVCLLPAQ